MVQLLSQHQLDHLIASSTAPLSNSRINMPWREACKKLEVDAASSIAPGSKVSSAFTWAPFSGGTAILASWIIVALLLRLNAIQFREVIKKTWHQVLGCLPGWSLYLWPCVRVQFSGMAGSLAYGFSKIGSWFIIVAPILGWSGVALSGSNTSTNAMFGAFKWRSGNC